MENLKLTELLQNLSQILDDILIKIIGIEKDKLKISLNYSDLRGMDININCLNKEAFSKILGRGGKNIQAIRRLLYIWGTRNKISVYLNLNMNK